MASQMFDFDESEIFKKFGIGSMNNYLSNNEF